MVQIKVGFSSLTIPNKILKGRNIVQSMTSNTNFPDPYPTLESVNNSINVLEQAYQAAADGGKSLTATMRERETALNNCIAQLAAYVQNKSDGNAEVIRSAGFDIRNNPGPITELDRPQNLHAATSQYSGEVTASWKPLHGAKTYICEKSADGNTGWSTCGHSTRAQIIIKELPSATYMWLRIAGIGAAGQGPWSDPVRVLVS